MYTRLSQNDVDVVDVIQKRVKYIDRKQLQSLRQTTQITRVLVIFQSNSDKKKFHWLKCSVTQLLFSFYWSQGKWVSCRDWLFVSQKKTENTHVHTAMTLLEVQTIQWSGFRGCS